MGSPGFIPAPGQGSAGQAAQNPTANPPDLNDPVLDQLAEYARRFLRDYPGLNRLTKGYDHSPRTLKWAIMDTLSDWSSTPPFIGQGLDMILQRNLVSVFIRGVVITAMESLGMLHLRNHLSYSDGGVNVQIENPQLIQSWLGMMKAEYEGKKQRILIALNIENALGPTVGGVHSELYFINCVGRGTPTIAEEGIFPIQDLVGKTVRVLSREGVYRPAAFMSGGVQELWEVKLSQGESFFATSNHEWPVVDSKGTESRVYTIDLLGRYLLKNTIQRTDEKIRVEAVQRTNRVEEVYCCAEPETHTFTIGSGVLTGNSFFGYL